MHRSGTSCLTGSLQQHGLFLGEVFESNQANLKGNRENAEVMKLNNSLLWFNGGSWDKPPISLNWGAGHAKARDHIIAKFVGSGHPLWGFKDPRTILTFDFWMEGLGSMDVKHLGSFRHPMAVAKSLLSRNKIPIEDGMELWRKYNAKLLCLQQKIDFPLICFDVTFCEYQLSLKKILEKLGLQSNPDTAELFFDELLRHNHADDVADLPESVAGIYAELVKTYQRQTR